jgi:hypothetical protein
LSELDEAWALALAEAEQLARQSGRQELADYLSLKNSNDLLRRASVDWLISSFVVLAGEANRAGSSIQITRQESHRFRVGASTMVGHQLVLSSGVRRLWVEAGWPRTPRDGIVRGRGLACGNIRHLGIRKADQELLLSWSHKGAPSWDVRTDSGVSTSLHESDLRRHLRILLDTVDQDHLQ